jgi:hypothetical protein
MSDTTVLSATSAAEATPAGCFLLVAICSLGVAAVCYVAGWLAAWADRRWPSTNRYQREGEQ